MAFEFPTDLIRQLQKKLRNDAGLSSYDPVDHTLPPLPSPAYPRCKHCRGSLVCELHSLMCAYCGKNRKGDVSLEPISFKSTFGCQFLLKSLGLNGSEMIGVPIKGSKSNKGSITRRKRIPLSELLDLQIKWPDSLLKPEINTANNTLEHSTSFSNFTGVDVGDFFPGSKNDTVHNSYEEQPVISNQIQSSESKPVASQDNLSLFQNVQPSETTVSSSNDVSSNAFTGWDANFQSADSGNQHWGSQPVDSFIGSTSTVDLSAHMDSNAKGNVDWFHDNQQPTNMTTVHENNMIKEGDNPFNEWNAFTSSTCAQDHSKHDWKQINRFSQADLLSGSSSHQSGSTEANNILSMDHTLDRISDAKSKVSDDIEHDMEKGNIVNVPTWPSDGAETIATQMHDISFMLDSNLSFPSKSDMLSSFSQD